MLNLNKDLVSSQEQNHHELEKSLPPFNTIVQIVSCSLGKEFQNFFSVLLSFGHFQMSKTRKRKDMKLIFLQEAKPEICMIAEVKSTDLNVGARICYLIETNRLNLCCRIVSTCRNNPPNSFQPPDNPKESTSGGGKKRPPTLNKTIRWSWGGVRQRYGIYITITALSCLRHVTIGRVFAFNSFRAVARSLQPALARNCVRREASGGSNCPP